MSTERPKILVIDDEADLGLALKRRLRRTCDVSYVTTARDALVMLDTEAIDVVLCDLMMPEMTGLELLEEISRTRPGLSRKIIFMTGGVFTPRMHDALERVPNPRIDKPLDIDALRVLMTRVMAA